MRGATRERSVDYAYINLRRRRWRRLFIEFQLAVHGIPAARIEALDGDSGGSVVPRSALQGGELGLVATWYDLVRSARTARAATWLVVIEDDAILGLSARNRIEQTLAQASPETAYVQLGFLSESSWRDGKPLKVNVLRKLGAARRAFAGGGRVEVPVEVLLDGTHLHAVRLERAADLLEAAAAADVPLDALLQRCAAARPGAFVRPAKSLASQFPFRSDILGARVGRRR